MNSISSKLPAAFHSLVSLLESQFSHLRFPGIDGAVLRTLEREVEAADAQVKAAERALEEARALLKTKETMAMERAERALSFLRVCAADDAELAQAIEGLSLQKPLALTEETAPKRRGRPRKADAPLFASVGASMDSMDNMDSSKDDATLAGEAALHA